MGSVALMVMFVLAVGGFTGELRAQEEVDLGEATRRASQALVQARAAFDEADFSQAVLLLNRLLDQQAAVAPSELPVEEADIRVEALKLRGIAFYNLGQADAAADDFAQLLQIRPDFALDSRLVSPKIVTAFMDVRQRVTGLLTVLTDPPGADVSLGRELLGATPLKGVRVPVGQYRLRVERAGYAADETAVDVVGGQLFTHDTTLVRNARSVSILTLPTAARVFIDGQELGMTSGTPPPGFEAVLTARGLNPSEASAPLIAPYLAAGEHVIRVEKECHTPFEATFEVVVESGDLPLELEPIVLVESIGSLLVNSSPARAEVLIDGEPRGTTPLQIERLCAGVHSLEVRQSGLGRWWGDVNLLAGDRRTVHAALKPTLASLGAVRQFGVENSNADRWDEFLAAVVQAQTAYNPVPVERGQGDETGLRWDLYRRLESGTKAATQLDPAFRQSIRNDFEADLFLVVVPLEAGRADLFLYGTRQGRADRLRVEGFEQQDVAELVEQLSMRTRLTTGWSGMLTVQTADSDFPRVIQVSALAPPGTTVVPGDLIESVGGRPVVSRRELEAEFADREPGLPVVVTVGRGGSHIEATVVTAESPVFPRPGDKRVLVNKYLADLELLRAAASGDEARALASIGIGLAYLMAGEPTTALEQGFGRASLVRPSGVNQGTLDYFKGLAYEAQGTARADRAIEAFRRAAAVAGATLWRDDGPFVAPFAAARFESGD